MRAPRSRDAAFLALSLLAALAAPRAGAQSVAVPLLASAWEATDSVRTETYLGRPSLYINRGVALARNLALENGTIEYDIAASATSSFLGAAFRATSPRFTEVVMLRVRQSGSIEAMQYAPAFNNVAAAWQVYHGDESNAVITVPRERWMHVRIELEGPTARVYYDTATAPTLTVPRLAGSGGNKFGVWAGAYGRGAYYSNIRYTVSAKPAAVVTAPAPAPGTVTNWELSNTIEPAAFTPTVLPNLASLTWEKVITEPAGFVLVNRYREQPNSGLPSNAATGAIAVDSVMTGKIAGSKIVYARAFIESPREELRRIQFMYSDGVVVYLNGKPITFAMNPQGFRDDLGVMSRVGDAAYLPLKQGRNELVFAVIEVGGGWAFGARLDAR